MIPAVLPVLLMLALQSSPSDVPSPAPVPAVTAIQILPQAQIPPPSSDPQVRQVGGSVSQPKVIHFVNPKFPEDARQLKLQGVTTISLIVDTRGNPTNVHVLHSMADTVDTERRVAALLLDQAALDAVSRYRFAPATENGKPVPVQIKVEVNFRIF